MKIPKLLNATIAIFTILILPSGVSAHPGRTDSNGGHTCRTNCPSWGLDYGEYHSHGGSSVSTPTPPPQTWSFNGKTYYSYSHYIQAQEDYKKEQARIAQEKLIQEKEAENQRLQDELVKLQEQQKSAQQHQPVNENPGMVAGATDNDNSSSSGTGAAVSVGALALLGGGGWYLYKKRKNKSDKSINNIT